MTLQTDGTTKFGDHYATYDFRTDSFSYTLGLCHVFSGLSMNTLEILKQILDVIDRVQLSLGHQAVTSKILSKSLIRYPTDMLLRNSSMKYYMIFEKKFYQVWLRTGNNWLKLISSRWLGWTISSVVSIT